MSINTIIKSIPNRLKAIYVIWVFLHLVLLLLAGYYRVGEYGSFFDKDFFPFEETGSYYPNNRSTDLTFNLSSYDISEFFIFTLIPIVVYLFFFYWGGKIKKNKIELSAFEIDTGKKSETIKQTANLTKQQLFKSKKFIFFYLIWILLQILILQLSNILGDNTLVTIILSDYSIIDFTLFILIPLIAYILFSKWMKNKTSNNYSSTSEVIEQTAEIHIYKGIKGLLLIFALIVTFLLPLGIFLRSYYSYLTLYNNLYFSGYTNTEIANRLLNIHMYFVQCPGFIIACTTIYFGILFWRTKIKSQFKVYSIIIIALLFEIWSYTIDGEPKYVQFLLLIKYAIPIAYLIISKRVKNTFFTKSI